MLGLLAARRWAGVGLALAVEAAVLAGLALAPPSETLGLPAAVATAIAGTVAVVFGAPSGALVALVGALVFAATGGWRAGELAALGVWPAIAAAVGLFAGRIERRRLALGHVVTIQERERRRLALELHDETAQALAGALMTLRAADRAATGPAAAEAGARARELITDTIRALRAIAVELSPKALEDYGLAPTLERLAATFSERTGLPVEVDARWSGRAADESELAVFRVVQEALAAAAADGAEGARVALERRHDAIVAVVEQRGGLGADLPSLERDAQRERLRLLGGSLTVSYPAEGRTLRVEVPAEARPTTIADP